jgi:hypothetical protein
MRIARWLFCGSATAVIAALAVEGCGSSSTYPDNVCGAPTPCNNPVGPTPAQVQQCTTQITDPTCGAAFQAMKDCVTYRATCTPSGSFDSKGTATACASEITAYGQCAKTLPDGGTDGCRRRTCSQASANCGQIDDGCGGKLTCGTCTNGQTCGGATPNRCSCVCDPTWCGTLSLCGTTLTCPKTCAAPQTCGGGGVANRCGCQPSGSTGVTYSTSVTTSAISVDGGSTASWSGANNARLSDTSYASATMVPNATSQYLVALSFGITLPPTATIDGIQVTVDRSATQGLATTDHAVYLVKNTQIQIAGDNKAAAGVLWPSAEASVSYGGSTDTWGNTWTPSEINAGFGVAFAARYTGQTGSEQARVDAISVTIHYSGVVCQ